MCPSFKLRSILPRRPPSAPKHSSLDKASANPYYYHRCPLAKPSSVGPHDGYVLFFSQRQLQEVFGEFRPHKQQSWILFLALAMPTACANSLPPMPVHSSGFREPTEDRPTFRQTPKETHLPALL